MTEFLSQQQLDDGGYVLAAQVDLAQYVFDPKDPELVTDRDGRVFRIAEAYGYQVGQTYLRLDPVEE